MVKESLIKLLTSLKSEIEKFSNFIVPSINNSKNELNRLSEIITKIEESWSGSWIGFHSNLYYKGYKKPKWNESFDSEWGSIQGIPEAWEEKNYTEISSFIEFNFDFKRQNILVGIQDFLNQKAEEAKKLQLNLCIELSLIKDFKNFGQEIKFLEKIENIKWGTSPAEFIKYRAPKQFMSRDTRAMYQGIKTPPHIEYQAKVYHCLSIISDIENFIKLSQRLIRQIEIRNNFMSERTVGVDSVSNVLTICKKLHLVANQLENRHNNRPTLKIEDEYDVQDLLHSLLKIYFDDVRPEEWTPSYAGGSSKIDFLLKKEKIVIEVKKTRQKLRDKEIGDQLLVDIAKYKKHSDCESLICFIYDPEGTIGNPKGLESDLNQSSDEQLNIITIIEPS